MKTLTSKLTLGGANLLALGMSAGDASMLIPQIADAGSSTTQKMSSSELRSVEASHLEVYAGCKWGHAAFDPVIVEGESLSPLVQTIYNSMA